MKRLNFIFLKELGKSSYFTKTILAIFLLCIVLTISGCATMIRGATGTTTPVTVRTDPSGATVIVGGQESTSPAVFTLEKKKNYQIVIKKKGYRSVIINLRSRAKAGDVGTSFLTNTAAFGWWSLGIGTAIGMLADAATGSVVDLDTDSIFVKLQQGEGEIVLEASDMIKKKKQKKEDKIDKTIEPKTNIQPARPAISATPKKAKSVYDVKVDIIE